MSMHMYFCLVDQNTSVECVDVSCYHTQIVCTVTEHNVNFRPTHLIQK